MPNATNGAQHMPLPFWEAQRIKSTCAGWKQLDVTTLVILSILPHTRMILLQETTIQRLEYVLTLQSL
jgi:hypothetical protein